MPDLKHTPVAEGTVTFGWNYWGRDKTEEPGAIYLEVSDGQDFNGVGVTADEADAIAAGLTALAAERRAALADPGRQMRTRLAELGVGAIVQFYRKGEVTGRVSSAIWKKRDDGSFESQWSVYDVETYGGPKSKIIKQVNDFGRDAREDREMIVHYEGSKA